MTDPNRASGPTPMPFDVAGARQAGYSDAEIVQHIGSTGKIGFDVDGALKAGYSPAEILDHMAPQPSGLIDNAREGIAEGLSGLGKTLKTYVGDGYGGDTLEKWGAAEAPANFVPTPIYDKAGFHASGILPTLARTAPKAAAVIGAGGLAAAAAPEALVGGAAIGAGALVGTALDAGNEAQQAADTRTGTPNSPIITADKLRGGTAAGASNVLGALPVGGYLTKLAGPLAKTGSAGALAALKKLGILSADQAAAGATSNAVDQGVQTVGTKGGLNVDPTQVINAGASGAVTGAAFGSKNAVRGALDASKYSAITPELKPAADMVANRITQFAGGPENLQGSYIGNRSAQEAGADAINKAGTAIQNELGGAVSDLRSRVMLPTDADNVLKSAMSGQTPSPREYGILQSAIAGDPQAANVTNLLQQAHVLDIVRDTGAIADGKFKGGITNRVGHMLTGENIAKSGIGVVGGAALEGGAGHIIAYSPHVLAAAAGATALARYLDNLTGAQAPAGRFVSNFGDDTGNVRLNVPQPPSQAPSGPQGPQAPLAGPPRPWSSPLATQAYLAKQRDNAAGNAAQRQALPLLKQLAAQAKAPVAPPVAGGSIITPNVRASMNAQATLAKLAADKAANQPEPAPTAPMQPPVAGGSILTPAVKAQMASRANLAKLAAAKATNATAPEPTTAQPAHAIDPLDLPRSITTPIMRGAATAQKLRDASAQAPVDPVTALAQKLQSGTARNGASQSAPSSVKKINGNSLSVSANGDSYKVPLAPYADLSVPEAAQRILRDYLASGASVQNSRAFVSKTIANLNTVRDKVQAASQAAPSVPPVELARFEGVRTQKSAAAYRDHLKREYPEAAPVLDKVFSDDAIARQWGQKQ